MAKTYFGEETKAKRGRPSKTAATATVRKYTKRAATKGSTTKRKTKMETDAWVTIRVPAEAAYQIGLALGQRMSQQ